jgi:hypothetical protein
MQVDLIDTHIQSKDGYRYALTAIDCCSKFSWCRELKTKQADEVASALLGIYNNEGVEYEILQSDNGGEFTGDLWKEVMDAIQAQSVRGRPRHPQSQGCVERLNGTIKTQLRRIIHENPDGRSNWPFHLKKIVHEYNITPPYSGAQTPTTLMRPATSTGHLTSTQIAQILAQQQINNQLAKERIGKNVARNQKHQQKTKTVRTLNVGDHVWVRSDKNDQMTLLYQHKAAIVDRRSNGTYSIRWLHGEKKGQLSNKR